MLERIKTAKIKIPANYIRTDAKPLNDDKENVYPILVDKKNNLVDGLQRLLKARKQKRRFVTVDKRDFTPSEVLEMQLILAIHQRGLNPIDKAKAFKRYIDSKKISGRTAAKNLSVTKSVIEYHLKLLELPAEIQKGLYEGRIKPYSLENILYRQRIKSAEQFLMLNSTRQFDSLMKKLNVFKRFYPLAKFTPEQITKLFERIREIEEMFR